MKFINNKKILKEISLTFLAGIIIYFGMVFENIFIQIPSLFIVSILFYYIHKSKNIFYHTLLAYIFFASFMIVLSDYFLDVFSSKILGIFLILISPLLFTNIFNIPNGFSFIRKSKNKILYMSVFWIFFSYIFLILPYVKNWWFPQIFYSQSSNLLLLQILPFFGIFGLLSIIIFSNYLTFYLYVKNKKHCILYIISFSLILIFGNFYLENLEEEKKDINFILVQEFREDGNYNSKNHIDDLIEIADKNYFDENNTIVLFSEIDIDETNLEYLKNKTKDKNYLVSGTYIKENGNDLPYNNAFILKNGELVFEVYKENSAPQEYISVKDNDKNIYYDFLDNKVFSVVCYDMHFLKTNRLLKNKDIILGHIKDDDFTKILMKFHKKDIIFRAVENRVFIAVSSSSGPTFYVNKYGKVIEELEFYKNGVLKFSV